MKINNKYEYQKYPIPVISIENKGDIGFSLNETWFEFFLKKDTFNNVSLEELITNYKVEIYGGKDCLVDFYPPNKPVANIISDVINSNEETIGIAVYFKELDSSNIKNSFFSICNLLSIF